MAEVHEQEFQDQFADGHNSGNAAEKKVVTMDAVLEHLHGLGDSASYTACMLRGSYQAQKDVIQFVHSLEGRMEIRMVETDAALLQWLHSCYLFVSSLPTFCSGTALPLTPMMASSGLIQ